MSEDYPFKSFQDFYPYYLREHENQTSRRLHFAGTTIAIVLGVIAVVTRAWWLFVVAAAQGYALAWVGHFFFEHKKPATFQFPLYSFMGDWRLWWETLTGKQRF